VSFASDSVHVPVPLHGPVQPAKRELSSGFAVSVTDVPLRNFALHISPQLMPAGVLVTAPVPLPEAVTVSATVAGGGGADAMTVAVTDVSFASDSVQVPVPEQAPDQPVNSESESGFAVSVTVAPLANLALHAEPQLIPDGALVTVPSPVPTFWTVSSIDSGELTWGEPQPMK